MSSSTCLIKEVLCYVKRFSNETFVIKIGKTIGEDAYRLGLVEDLRYINKIDIQLVVICDAGLNFKEWGSGVFTFCKSVEALSSKIGKGKIVVLATDLLTDVLAKEVAVRLRARKIVFVTDKKGIFSKDGSLIEKITANQAEKLVEDSVIKGGIAEKVLAAVGACKSGVKRAHIISGKEKGSLLLEIFSCNGVGSMIFSSVPYDVIRRACGGDISLIRDIASVNFQVSEKKIRETIDSWYVFDIDGEVIACVLADSSDGNITTINFLSCDENYNQPVVLKTLVSFLCQKNKGHKLVLDFSTNSIIPLVHPWFKSFGFGRVKEGLYIKE